MKKISVIMPAYNCEKTIKRAINSILNQTFNDYELIIIDDGSTDNTYNICTTMKCDNMKIIHQNNKGPSYARNSGIKMATGEYIMFIDADDCFKNNAIEIMYNNIKKDNVDMVTAGFEYNNGSRKKVNFKNNKIYFNKGKYIDNLQKKNLLNSNWNKIYKTEIIKKNNIQFDIDKEIGEDVRFNFQYIKYANTFSTCNSIIYEYNYNNDGLTNKNEKDKVERIYKFLIFQKNYYEKFNLNSRKFQKKIIKDFIYIYTKNEKIDRKLEELILSIDKKTLAMYILYRLCKTKKKIIIKTIIKKINRIRN